MNEENKNIPENEETLNEPAENNAETENAETGNAETENSAPVNRPANFMRSGLTAVIVLAIFVAVYFAVSALNGGKSKTEKAPEQKPMTEASIGSVPAGENAEKPKAPADGGDKKAPEKPAGENGDASKPASSNAPDEKNETPEFKKAQETLTADAQKKYGATTIVLPEYNYELRTIVIDGAEHKCYMMAAVKLTAGENSSTDIIHAAIDPETNEIWYDDSVKWEVK